MKNNKEKITIAKYIADFFARQGVQDVFMVTGGGAMFLNDAFSSHKKLNCYCLHNEQSCAMAAESYYKIKNKPALVNVTTGPGSTNAITGVFGAYVDSCAMIVISGQVKRPTMKIYSNLPLRQLGDQEIDIVPMVKGITKYATVLDDPHNVDFELNKAIYEATTSRPGPVWIDVPIDIQSMILPVQKKIFVPPKYKENSNQHKSTIKTFIEKLNKSKRPVIIAGTGIHQSETKIDLINFSKKFRIPIVSSFCASDVIPTGNNLFIGRQGTIGDRPGNFAVENADMVIILGSRMGIRQTSYDWKKFAQKAYKVMVDIDHSELNKPTLTIDLKINCNLRVFFDEIKKIDFLKISSKKEYLTWCLERKKKYPAVLNHYYESKKLNPYVFMKMVSDIIPNRTAIVTADGAAAITSFQAFETKEGQRLFSNSGSAPMGYDLPGAIGASIAVQKLKKFNKRVICFAGDGSIMMNLQELQSIKTMRIPITVFIINNGGYLSILQTQLNYFRNNVFGCINSKELTFPDFKKIAKAFGFKYLAVKSTKDVSNVTELLDSNEPNICEVFVDPKQFFEPKLVSKRNDDGTFMSPDLDDMYPFLNREELIKNRI